MPPRKDSKPDASHSRTYLTKRNYTGPQLLQTIRNDLHSPRSPSSTQSRTGKAAMRPEQDIDVMALPLSSDEESAESIGSMKRKANELKEDEDLQPRKHARVEPTAMRATRNSRARAASCQQEDPPNSSMSIPDFLELSQSSQQRKRKTQYGKMNSYSNHASEEPAFADPGDVPLTPRKTRNQSFKSPGKSPVNQRQTPKRKLKEMGIPALLTPGKTRKAFQMPDQFNMPESSSASTDMSNVFDADDTLKIRSRGRAGSTSSLSSLDSIVSYELSQKQKDQLNSVTAAEEAIPKGCALCPLCQRVVDTCSTYLTGLDPSELSLRKQQIFCHAHRVKDAHTEWKSRKLPPIDWITLDQKRIPKYVPHLRQVLYRKVPSYYLDRLESTLGNARGNQTKIRRYLAHELVEIVKPGYYGPKGAKIMGNRITTDMSNHLKRSLKADKAVRAVGVAGFISAVLLPELLEQVVIDDLGLGDGGGDGDRDQQEEARKVIDESTEIGMLLWPDDDHVVMHDVEGNDDDDDIIEAIDLAG